MLRTRIVRPYTAFPVTLGFIESIPLIPNP